MPRGEVGLCGVAIDTLEDMAILFEGIPLEKVTTSMAINAHNDFFEEIAKFRAARRIWAREIKRRYNPQNPASCALRFHTQTAGCTLIAEQPRNNIVRVAIQALAGVLGGTQSLHTDSMDETFATPSEEAATTALRNPADYRSRNGGGEHHRPPGRLLLRGIAHRQNGRGGLSLL